jgi:effector-binding domain-containing protein
MTDLLTGQLTDIRTEERPERPAASIPIEAPMSEWGRVNALVAELGGWMPAHGATPVGPPFYRYRRIGDVTVPFELSVGFELTEPTTGDDRVRTDPIPAGHWLVAIHNGHPDKIADSHRALLTHAEQSGVTVAPGPADDDRPSFAGMIETYLTDPAERPDLNDWQVEIAYLVA